MCGIAGIIDLKNQKTDPKMLKGMVDSMFRRGPDDEGFFLSDNVALGMRRLSIIDPSSGKQPVSNETGSVVAVMNGEIYNYIELREELIRQGHIFQSQSDTEVLVHAYEESGIDFIHHLNGMFAFALWDRSQQILWIVRDRLGIKPLYWLQNSGSVVFSSDLLSIPSSLRGPVSSEGLIDYLCHGYVGGPHSLFANVSKLLPGHWLRVDKSGIKTERWWHLEQAEKNEKISSEEAAEELERLLKQAVHLQLRSDVPLGVLLSGGIDSSAVTALTAQDLGGPVTTFTVDFLGKGGQDASFAKQVSLRYQTDHFPLHLTPERLLSGLDEVLQFMDEPIADSAIVPTYLISKHAREKGIKVLLTGAGGDELFCGYRRYFSPRFGSPEWMASMLSVPLRHFVGFAWGVLQPHQGWRARDPGVAYLSSISGVDLGFYQKILKTGIFQTLLNKLHQNGQEAVGNSPTLEDAYSRMRFDTQHYLVDNILSLTDKATMGASVEGRVPLLDHRIAEFAFSLPRGVNFSMTRPKDLLCKALSPYLPLGLLERKKEGFNAPVDAWTTNGLYHTLREELSNCPSGVLTEILDTRRLNSLLRQTPKQPYRSGTLFSLYVLNRWCRKAGMS